MTIPFQPGLGLATYRNFVPVTGANPSGVPPAPVAVHRGIRSGSVRARHTAETGYGYSRTMRISLMRERYRGAGAGGAGE